MSARASHPLAPVGNGLVSAPTEVWTDTDFLMYQLQRPPGVDAFNNAITMNSNVDQNTRPYVPQIEPASWDSINNMNYTRFRPSTIVPDYGGLSTNTLTMLLWMGIVAGAMAAFLRE